MQVLYKRDFVAIRPFEPVLPCGCRPEPVVELSAGSCAQLIDRDITTEMITGIAVLYTDTSLLAGNKKRYREYPQKEGAD